jgi:hypothetical protein
MVFLCVTTAEHAKLETNNSNSESKVDYYYEKLCYLQNFLNAMNQNLVYCIIG